MIIIWGSGNDFSQSIPMGTDADEQNRNCVTFRGSLMKLFDNLIARFPNTIFAFILPMKRDISGNSSFTPNSIELIQKDYIDAIKVILDKYSIPYLNMYEESPFSAFFAEHKTNYFVDGGLHPNHKGYELMAKRIGSWINSL